MNDEFIFVRSYTDLSIVQYIYGTEMTNVTSGGIVYEYFQDDENLGMYLVLEHKLNVQPANISQG